MCKKELSKYEELRKTIKKKCIFPERNAIDDFNEVNACIETILKQSNNDALVEIKSLICQFEGKMNKASFYTAMAIAYALLIGAVTIVDKNSNENMALFLTVLIASIVVAILSIMIANIDYENSFILKVLNFKLDEIIEKNKQNEADCESPKKEEKKSEKNCHKSNHRQLIIKFLIK